MLSHSASATGEQHEGIALDEGLVLGAHFEEAASGVLEIDVSAETMPTADARATNPTAEEEGHHGVAGFVERKELAGGNIKHSQPPFGNRSAALNPGISVSRLITSALARSSK